MQIRPDWRIVFICVLVITEKVEPRPVTQDFGVAIMSGTLGISEEHSKGLLDFPSAVNDVIPGELRAMIKSRETQAESDTNSSWNAFEAFPELRMLQGGLTKDVTEQDGMSLDRPAPSFYEYYISRRNDAILRTYYEKQAISQWADLRLRSLSISSDDDDDDRDLSSSDVPMNSTLNDDLSSGSSSETSEDTKWIARYSPEPVTSTQFDLPFNKNDPNVYFKNLDEMSLIELTEFLNLDLETYASMEDLEDFL